MRRWRFLVWLVPPLMLISVLAILYGPSLAALWTQMPADQASQLQVLHNELEASHPGLVFFQTPERDRVTLGIYDVKDSEEQEELVTWLREARARLALTFEICVEFYEKGKPPGENSRSSGQERKLLKKVDL